LETKLIVRNTKKNTIWIFIEESVFKTLGGLAHSTSIHTHISFLSINAFIYFQDFVVYVNYMLNGCIIDKSEIYESTHKSLLFEFTEISF